MKYEYLTNSLPSEPKLKTASFTFIYYMAKMFEKEKVW